MCDVIRLKYPLNTPYLFIHSFTCINSKLSVFNFLIIVILVNLYFYYKILKFEIIKIIDL